MSPLILLYSGRSRILFFIYRASHFKQSLIQIIESHLTTGFRPASTTPPLHLSSVYTVLWLKLGNFSCSHTKTLETFQLRSSYFIYFQVQSVAQKVQNNEKGLQSVTNRDAPIIGRYSVSADYRPFCR